ARPGRRLAVEAARDGEAGPARPHPQLLLAARLTRTGRAPGQEQGSRLAAAPRCTHASSPSLIRIHARVAPSRSPTTTLRATPAPSASSLTAVRVTVVAVTSIASSRHAYDMPSWSS